MANAKRRAGSQEAEPETAGAETAGAGVRRLVGVTREGLREPRPGTQTAELI